MNNDELKKALFTREPVMHMGIRYDYVSAVIYRTVNGKLQITAELTDGPSHSTIVVHAKAAQRIGAEGGASSALRAPYPQGEGSEEEPPQGSD